MNLNQPKRLGRAVIWALNAFVQYILAVLLLISVPKIGAISDVSQLVAGLRISLLFVGILSFFGCLVVDVFCLVSRHKLESKILVKFLLLPIAGCLAVIAAL